MTDRGDRLLSLPDVAARTATSTAFWRKAIARRAIPIVRVGRCVRIREADLEAWLRVGLQPAGGESRR